MTESAIIRYFTKIRSEFISLQLRKILCCLHNNNGAVCFLYIHIKEIDMEWLIRAWSCSKSQNFKDVHICITIRCYFPVACERRTTEKEVLNCVFLLFTDILKLNKLNFSSHNSQLLPPFESFEESMFLLKVSGIKTENWKRISDPANRIYC
jgi:hypothetical protein